MKDTIAANLIRFRKEQNLTQEELAKQLGITSQAVSKWETAQSTPDISLLPALASILRVSIDKIMGYSHNFDARSYYEASYEKDEYFWGIKPSDMCLKVLELLPPTRPLKLIDVGCGEGKDAVFFARCGYSVSAFDLSDAGIEKTKRLADKANVFVDAFKADIYDFRLEQDFDVVYSSGMLHYIKPELSGEIIENYKKFTRVGGVHAMHCFVEKPFVHRLPNKKSHSQHWKSGHLLGLYHDWFVESTSEYVFDCNSGGVPHRHAANRVFARKPEPEKQD